jgi:hypothetical protein
VDQGTFDVRYAFNTGRTADIAGTPSRAINGLMHRNTKALFDHLVGEREQR